MVSLLFMMYNQNKEEQSENDEQTAEEKDNGEKDADQQKVYWGVDAAGEVDEQLYQCVTENFGDPEVFGRYLGEIEDVAVALNQDEVSFLHDQDVKILVIYNLIPDATTFDAGVEHAERAIELAKELDIPEGITIFGDIEPDFPVDSAFIEGWHETLDDSPYVPALYGVFDEESDLVTAYNDTDDKVQKSTIVWTAYPQRDISSKDNAPKYEAQGPEHAKIYGWQYAI